MAQTDRHVSVRCAVRRRRVPRCVRPAGATRHERCREALAKHFRQVQQCQRVAGGHTNEYRPESLAGQRVASLDLSYGVQAFSQPFPVGLCQIRVRFWGVAVVVVERSTRRQNRQRNTKPSRSNAATPTSDKPSSLERLNMRTSKRANRPSTDITPTTEARMIRCWAFRLKREPSGRVQQTVSVVAEWGRLSEVGVVSPSSHVGVSSSRVDLECGVGQDSP